MIAYDTKPRLRYHTRAPAQHARVPYNIGADAGHTLGGYQGGLDAEYEQDVGIRLQTEHIKSTASPLSPLQRGFSPPPGHRTELGRRLH